MKEERIKELREKLKDKEYMKRAMESIADRIISGEIKLEEKKGEKDVE
jgi:hypothetical protein